FYPMFFGMLLTALHENKTQVPIFGIVLKDVETAFEDPDTRQGFVNCIASGIYISNGQYMNEISVDPNLVDLFVGMPIHKPATFHTAGVTGGFQLIYQY
ncbi:hypothetical protein, partial [Acinetobacter baumannii]